MLKLVGNFYIVFTSVFPFEQLRTSLESKELNKILKEKRRKGKVNLLNLRGAVPQMVGEKLLSEPSIYKS